MIAWQATSIVVIASAYRNIITRNNQASGMTIEHRKKKKKKKRRRISIRQNIDNASSGMAASSNSV